MEGENYVSRYRDQNNGSTVSADAITKDVTVPN
jgi:hypothetical protein